MLYTEPAAPGLVGRKTAMNIRLDQKRALVTGGNSGIGEAIVLGLAEAGAKVAINYITHPDAAQLLVQRISERNGEAIALQADVSDPEAIAQMFAHIDNTWGGIDNRMVLIAQSLHGELDAVSTKAEAGLYSDAAVRGKGTSGAAASPRRRQRVKLSLG